MTGTAEWLDDREQRTWQAFHDMQVLLWRRLSHHLARETGLSEPDYAVLTALAAAPGGRMRPFELSVVTDFEKSRLHHHLTRMVERGLVTREKCADAPRGAEIALTATGRDAIDGAAPQRAEHVRRWLLQQLTKEQMDALTEISDAVLTNLRSAGRPSGHDEESCAPTEC